MLNCEISYSFGRQTALNDNGVRPSAHHGSKGFGEPLIRPWYRDGLNLNPGDAFDTEAKEFVCLVQMFGTLDLDDTAPGG